MKNTEEPGERQEERPARGRTRGPGRRHGGGPHEACTAAPTAAADTLGADRHALRALGRAHEHRDHSHENGREEQRVETTTTHDRA